MDIDRVNFASLANGGDDVTGALVKIDQNCADLADSIGDVSGGTGSVGTRLHAVEQTIGGLGDAATKNVGTTAGTVAAGNDSRLRAVGTTTGTVAAGDDARITGAAAKTYVDQQDALRLPIASPTFTGVMNKAGVTNAFNYRITNINSEIGIGGTLASWSGDRTPAVQVDAQSNVSAYGMFRATHWGVKHLFQADVYEGGSGGGALTELCFHFAPAIQRFRFFETGNAIFAGTLTQNSDYRIKDDVVDIEPEAAAAGLRLLRPIEYTDSRQPEGSPRLAGYIAHELQAPFPLLVVGEKDAVQESVEWQGDTTPYPPGEEPDGWVPPVQVVVETPVLQSVNYDRQVVYLTAGWQEHDERIARLEQQLAEARDRIDALEQR